MKYVYSTITVLLIILILALLKVNEFLIGFISGVSFSVLIYLFELKNKNYENKTTKTTN